MKKIVYSLVVLGALVAGALFLGFSSLRQPALALSEEKIVEIPRGASTLRIGEILEEAGLLRSPLQTALYRVLNPKAKFQAGEYSFRKETSAAAVLAKIARGEVYFRDLTIPEGSNIFDIARIVGEQKILDAEEFLRAAKDPATIRDLAPGAQSLEGYLFPSTYRLPRKLTAEGLCGRLTKQFREAANNLKLDAGRLHELVTLASLVEKESAVPEERPKIAGLFTNRLKLGMKLECDPTTIYAALLQEKYRGTIYRSDLDSKHPYNTYQHVGLPPGPIANPGLEALRAAAHPEATDAIFFVAEPNGTGRHVFSKSLAAHNEAVAKYRRGAR
jgi:UPF0755 protein